MKLVKYIWYPWNFLRWCGLKVRAIAADMTAARVRSRNIYGRGGREVTARQARYIDRINKAK